MLFKALAPVALVAALAASALHGREAAPSGDRWTSSFAPADAGFSIDLPVRERRWMRATELQAGLEGFTCRDAEKRAVYTVVFGSPARPWTAKDARAFLEGVAATEPAARIERACHEGRSGFELTASSSERSVRHRVFLDGPRVVILSVVAAVEGDDTARFFTSLEFTHRGAERQGVVVAGAVASRR